MGGLDRTIEDLSVKKTTSIVCKKQAVAAV
jgi:hypothetical protein